MTELMLNIFLNYLNGKPLVDSSLSLDKRHGALGTAMEEHAHMIAKISPEMNRLDMERKYEDQERRVAAQEMMGVLCRIGPALTKEYMAARGEWVRAQVDKHLNS